MLRRGLFTLLLTLWPGAVAFGQQAGQIVGVVSDGSGAALPGITVRATEVLDRICPQHRHYD